MRVDERQAQTDGNTEMQEQDRETMCLIQRSKLVLPETILVVDEKGERL